MLSTNAAVCACVAGPLNEQNINNTNTPTHSCLDIVCLCSHQFPHFCSLTHSPPQKVEKHPIGRNHNHSLFRKSASLFVFCDGKLPLWRARAGGRSSGRKAHQSHHSQRWSAGVLRTDLCGVHHRRVSGPQNIPNP